MVIDGTVVGHQGANTVLTIFPIAFNTGAPSVLTVSGLTLTLPDGKVVKGWLIAPPLGQLTLAMEDGSAPRVLVPEDYFPRKAMRAPIIDGGTAGGWMSFLIPDLKPNELVGTALISLSCADVRGEPVNVTRRVKEESSPQVFVPSN